MERAKLEEGSISASEDEVVVVMVAVINLFLRLGESDVSL
jgi:hypothetical protein